MLKEGFYNFSDAHLTYIGLFIFVSFFIGLLIWVFLPIQKKHFERMRNLPLEKEIKGKEGEKDEQA